MKWTFRGWQMANGRFSSVFGIWFEWIWWYDIHLYAWFTSHVPNPPLLSHNHWTPICTKQGSGFNSTWILSGSMESIRASCRCNGPALWWVSDRVVVPHWLFGVPLRVSERKYPLDPSSYLTVCYANSPIYRYIMVYHRTKLAIFHSYIKLLDGNKIMYICTSWKEMAYHCYRSLPLKSPMTLVT